MKKLILLLAALTVLVLAESWIVYRWVSQGYPTFVFADTLFLINGWRSVGALLLSSVLWIGAVVLIVSKRLSRDEATAKGNHT